MICRLWRKRLIVYFVLLSILAGCSSVGYDKCKHKFEPLSSDNNACQILYDGFIFYEDIDFVIGKYRVATYGGVFGVEAANVPIDAVRRGLLEFVKLDEGYEYLDAISIAVQKGIEKNGTAEFVALLNKEKIIRCTIYYSVLSTPFLSGFR